MKSTEVTAVNVDLTERVDRGRLRSPGGLRPATLLILLAMVPSCQASNEIAQPVDDVAPLAIASTEPVVPATTARPPAAASDDEAGRRIAELEQQVQFLRRQLASTMAALVEADRRLYRSTPQEERQAVLVTWLSDPQFLVRRLAIELSDKRLENNQPIGAEMVTALRGRLEDPRAEIRRAAALLLSNLRDEQSADTVAALLAGGAEEEIDVIRAYLQVMVGRPRAAAVDPAMSMLGHDALRGPAAAALTSALKQNLLNPDQIERAATRVRALVHRNAAPPEPPVIALLARLADEDDWTRIAAWLDADEERVKDAAARAWAESGRPLWELARRAGSEPFLQIVIAQARQRGEDPRTMIALVQHPPEDAQVIVAWKQALTEMAARVPAAAVLVVDRHLAQSQGPDNELREQLLTTSITRLTSAGNGAQGADPAPNLDEPTRRLLTDLYLGRAGIRLERGAARAALEDLRAARPDELDPVRRRRRSLGLLKAHLAAGDDEAAATEAETLLRHEATTALVAGTYLDIARKNLAARQFDRALELTLQLQDLIGTDPPATLMTAARNLQKKIEDAIAASKATTPESDSDAQAEGNL
ncbi:MAG: hypothetical protein CMJ18_17350 [Phycisphaeraceae bacterium]|nr:hypothetical protein [Phycisphaeraceae bacterium]